ncbi:hypothetical protein, partial [Leclercia adecarboxylata]
PSPQEKTRMHTRNVNVKTAAQESSGRCDSTLSVAQFTELFCWVLAATEGEPQPAVFTPPACGLEMIMLNKYSDERVSIWIVDSWPVAITLPQENFFRVLTSVKSN